MPILNYTTKIDPNKSVGEIQGILGQHGARSIFTDYDEFRNVTAIGFVLFLERDSRPLNFRLPCNVDGVLAALKKQKGVPYSMQNREHARRVTWRIIKDWLAAQLALIEAGQAEMAEVFMPYAIAEDGRTAYQMFRESHIKQLNAAPDNVVEGKFAATGE